MSAVLFTDIVVNQLKATEKQFEVFDKRVKGLALRVSPGGTKTFSILYRFGGRNRRHTFGPYPTVSLKDARQRAQEALRQVSNGIDPQTTKLQARSTYTSNLFSNVTAEFIETYAKRNTRTWRETERILQNEALSRWSMLPISQISKPMIKSAINEIFKASGPSAANHAFAAFRRLFNWSVEQGYLDHSPCLGMKPPSRTVERSRVLTDPELASIWGCL